MKWDILNIIPNLEQTYEPTKYVTFTIVCQIAFTHGYFEVTIAGNCGHH